MLLKEGILFFHRHLCCLVRVLFLIPVEALLHFPQLLLRLGFILRKIKLNICSTMLVELAYSHDNWFCIGWLRCCSQFRLFYAMKMVMWELPCDFVYCFGFFCVDARCPHGLNYCFHCIYIMIRVHHQLRGPLNEWAPGKGVLEVFLLGWAQFCIFQLILFSFLVFRFYSDFHFDEIDFDCN